MQIASMLPAEDSTYNFNDEIIVPGIFTRDVAAVRSPTAHRMDNTDIGMNHRAASPTRISSSSSSWLSRAWRSLRFTAPAGSQSQREQEQSSPTNP
jgi:hypothetical protein